MNFRGINFADFRPEYFDEENNEAGMFLTRDFLHHNRCF